MRFFQLLLLEEDFPHSEIILACKDNLLEDYIFLHKLLLKRIFTLDDLEGCRENLAKFALTGIVANSLSFL